MRSKKSFVRIGDLFPPPILLILSTLIWTLPLIFDRFQYVSDLAVHYQWAAQFERAIQEGVFVPRWATLSHNGLGDPTFLHIHPLYYYLVAAANAIVSDLWLSMKLIVILSHLSLGLAIFHFVSRKFSRNAGLLAALTAQWMPYCFFLVDYSQMFPAMLAIAIAAVALGLIFRDRLDSKWISLVAFSLSLVIVAHILVAFTMLMTLTMAIIAEACVKNGGSKRDLSLIVSWSTSVVLSLGITSWYWIPAVLERHMINPQVWDLGQIANPMHGWSRNFAFPVFTALKHGSTYLSIHWLAPLPLFLVGVYVLRLLAFRPEVWAEANGRLLRIVSVTCLLSLFFSCGLSWPVWKLIPSLQQLQFPWRFLGIAGITAAVLVGGFVASDKSSQSVRRLGFLPCVLGVVITVLLAGQALYAGKVVVPSERWLAGSFGQPEYLPAWVPSSQLNAERLGKDHCRGESKRCSVVRDNSHEKVYRVLVDQVTDLEFPIHFHPGWHATLAGAAIELKPSSARGLVEATLPAGEHVIKIYWGGTMLEQIGMWVSIFSIFLGIILPLVKTIICPAVNYLASRFWAFRSKCR